MKENIFFSKKTFLVQDIDVKVVKVHDLNCYFP